MRYEIIEDKKDILKEWKQTVSLDKFWTIFLKQKEWRQTFSLPKFCGQFP